MADVISTFELKSRVALILEQFKNVTDMTLREATDATTKEIVEDLRNTSPRSPGGGDYAKSWTRTSGREKKREAGYGRIVYVRAPHYRLTHLLEYGHELPQGGRAKAIPHIAAAEERGIDAFERRLVEGITNADF